MPLECPQCAYLIPFEGDRPPPWCPKCGSDLKPKPKAAAASEPAAPSAPPSPPPSIAAPEAPPPAVVEQAGVTYETASSSIGDFSRPEAEFGGSMLYRTAAWVTALVCFGIAGIAAWQFVNPPKKKLEPGVLYGVMGMFGLFGTVSLFVGMKIGGQKYVLYPDRFVAVEGGQETTVHWEEVRDVYQAVHPSWTTYRIVTRLGGKEFNLTGELSGHRRLGDAIAERVALMLLPEAVRNIDAGRAVTFGPLRVSRAGVEVNGEMVSWNHIPSISFGPNPRPVKEAGGRISNMMHLKLTPGVMIEMGQIPNFKLFQALVRHCNPACLVG